MKGRRCGNSLCDTAVPHDRLFCPDCWLMVKPATQRELIDAYTPGVTMMLQSINFCYLRERATKEVEDYLWGRC